MDLEPRRTADGRSQQALLEPVDALDSRGIRGVDPASAREYADPFHYQLFLDELFQRSSKTAMSCDFSTESTRGNLEDFATRPTYFVRFVNPCV